MLTQLLLVAPKEDDEQGGFSTVARYEALLPAAMVAVDKYLVANPNIDLSAAQGSLFFLFSSLFLPFVRCH